MEFTVCRESLPLTDLDAESTTCWVAQLAVEVLQEVAVQYKLSPPPPLSAWTSKNIFPLQQVYVVGATGAPDKPWHRNDDVDVWLHRSRLVCDIVTDQLQQHQLGLGASPELAIRVKGGRAATATVADVGAWATVTVPTGFAQLSAHDQQESVIGSISEVVERRAQRDGFEASSVLNGSLALLRSEDATYRRCGSWVSDPTGQYRARWRFEGHWSGLGYEQLEMVDQAGAPVTSTRWVPAGPTPWAVLANKVYWSDREPMALVQYPHFKGRVDLLELRPTDPPESNGLPDRPVGGRLENKPTIHPRFSAHFSKEFYLDDGNDLAPFGSDEGADILASWLDRADALTRSRVNSGPSYGNNHWPPDRKAGL